MDWMTTLIFSFLFGTIGLGYFIYGKKQSLFVPLFTGLALMVYPYFVSNSYVMVAVGIVLCAVPWVASL